MTRWRTRRPRAVPDPADGTRVHSDPYSMVRTEIYRWFVLPRRLQIEPSALVKLAEKILTSKSALEGERKQVTVLFAELKGWMEREFSVP